MKLLGRTGSKPERWGQGRDAWHGVAAVLLACLLGAVSVRGARFDLATATAGDIQSAFAAGALNSEKLVSLYLARVAAYDQQGPRLAAFLTLNPKALEEARALDAERKASGRCPIQQEIGSDGGGGSGMTADTRNSLSSYTGLPTIIVPGGFFPGDGMPFGLQFLGRNFSEPTLIKLASGYEAVTAHRKAPATTPALAGENISY